MVPSEIAQGVRGKIFLCSRRAVWEEGLEMCLIQVLRRRRGLQWLLLNVLVLRGAISVDICVLSDIIIGTHPQMVVVEESHS